MTSLVLRTVRAFPRGRTTLQIARHLDLTFDRARREAMRQELLELQEEGEIDLGADGRWRPRARARTDRPGETARQGGAATDGTMRAVPVRVRRSPFEIQAEAPSDDGVPDPRALLRYYMSALRSDPRGALTQAPDRHGTAWQSILPEGPWLPKAGEALSFELATADLPADFREALMRRADGENGLAVGWPLEMGRHSGAVAVRPVGLLAATWSQDATGDTTTMHVQVASDEVVVNPDWIAAHARDSAWTRDALRDLLSGPGGGGLPVAEFRIRLREVAAGAIGTRGLDGLGCATLDADDTGLHDAVGLFLPTGATFTAGAVRDLDAISSWGPEVLSGTALWPLLGQGLSAGDPSALDPVGAGPLNGEQLEAARIAGEAALSVVTGPPGTGKSQSIAAMVATALLDGQSVVVASRNHQALDAVEERLRGMAPGTPFAVRTLNPEGDVDVDMRKVLDALLSEPARTALLPDPSALDRLRREARETAEALDAARAAHLARAETLDRDPSRAPSDRDTASAPHRGIWGRMRDWLAGRRRAAGSERPGAVSSPAHPATRLGNTDELGTHLVMLTERIAEEVRTVLPDALAARVTLTEEARACLESDAADLDLAGQRDLAPDLARRIVQARPLWLVSVLGAPRRVPLVPGLFDLAIVDEASQCDIGAALPVLARARRAVIVGDDRQLGFVPGLGAAQDRNLMAAQGLGTKGMGRFAQGARSLFALARSTDGAPRTLLRKQYRSASDITDYISGAFYGGRLEPAVDETGLRVPEGRRAGIAWQDVPGRSGRARADNPAEAERVAIHLRDLLADGYDGSVGIVTPFRDQVRAIETALRGRVSDAALAGCALKVGTVDAFQGQERDVILFSPTLHAGSASSSVAFVSRDWRRLNVAISRARAVVLVFGDLDFARSGAVRELTRLAARATEPRVTRGEGTFDSWPERRMAEALAGRGLDAHPQYEIAGRRLDFALFGAGGVKLDLEVDGRRWHMDADGGRKIDDHWRDAQLRALGWKVRRFWVDEMDRDIEVCLDLVERDLGRTR